MNIVDSLIVSLGLDPSGFTKGQKEAAAAQAKLKSGSLDSANEIEKANAKAGESVAALGRKFLGLYVLLTAGKGVKQFVADITAADAALGRTARNLDMSGRNLSAWQNAATVAGGSAEGITGTLRGLTSEMQKAALTGQSSVIPAFRALGINLADAKGHARDATDVLRDMNKVFNERHLDPARFTEIAHMAGIDDGTIALLEKTTGEFTKLIDEQQKYAASADDIDAAQKRQSGWRQLLITSQSVGRTILTAVTPAIIGVMKAVQDWANANQDFIKTKVAEYAERLAVWVKSVDWAQVATDVGAFATKVGEVASAVATALQGIDGNSALTKALEALAVLAGVRLVASFSGLSAAIGGLGSLSLPGWFTKMIGLTGAVAVGATAESTPDADTQKRMDDFYKANPDKSANPFVGIGQWWKSHAATWAGGDSPEAKARADDTDQRRTDQRAAEANAEAKNPTSVWSYFKHLVGLGDDPKVKDGIADTAKATGEIRDLMKAQKDGVGSGVDGVTASSGGLGGSGHHADGSSPGASLRDRQFHGKGNFGEKGWWTPERQGHAIDVLMKQGGLTEDGAKALVARWKFVESAGGPTAVNPKSGAQGIAQWLGTRKGDGSGGSFDEQLGKVARELNGKEAHAKSLLNTPGREANGASAYERAEGWNAATNTDNFTDRVREGMKHIVHGAAAAAPPASPGAATPASAPASPTPTPASGPSEADYIAALRRSNDGWKLKPATQARLDQDKADQAIIDAFAKTHHDAWKLADKALKTGMGLTHVEPGPEVRGKARNPAWDTKGPNGEVYHTADMRDPKYAPHPITVDHAIRHVLKTLAHARGLTHHDDSKPIPVMPVDRHGNPGDSGNPLADLHRWRFDGAMKHAQDHAASIARMTRMAAVSGQTVHHTVNHNSDVRVGEMHVATPSSDGRRFASEFRDDMMRRGDVTMGNGALASMVVAIGLAVAFHMIFMCSLTGGA